jgi:hypothetical protein
MRTARPSTAQPSTAGGDATALFQSTVLTDNSDPDYCLAEAEKEDKFFASRKLSSSATRAIRVLMHGCLTVGFCVGGTEWAVQFREIVNPGHITDGSKDAPG